MSVLPKDSQQPPDWRSDYFRDARAVQGSRHGSGLVGHVPFVAVLLIVQGTLEIVFSLFGAAFLAFVYLVPDKDLASMRGLGIFMLVLAMPAALCGALRIVAGIFNVRYRRRGLGMVALGLGLLTMITGYCAPSSIALAIYGLIVYVNEPVVAAFELGEQGRKPSEIRAVFGSS
jgi:hypothetical protein